MCNRVVVFRNYFAQIFPKWTMYFKTCRHELLTDECSTTHPQLKGVSFFSKINSYNVGIRYFLRVHNGGPVDGHRDKAVITGIIRNKLVHHAA